MTETKHFAENSSPEYCPLFNALPSSTDHKTYVLTSGIYPAMRDSHEFSGGSEILLANPIQKC